MFASVIGKLKENLNSLVLYGLNFNIEYFERGRLSFWAIQRQTVFMHRQKRKPKPLAAIQPDNGAEGDSPQKHSIRRQTLQEAAKTYFDAQSCLAKLNLAPSI